MARPAIWTEEMALHVGYAFMALYHRLPTSADYRRASLPHDNTVRRLFGSVRAYQQRLRGDACSASTQTRTCLRCDTAFLSAGPGHRICDLCKREDDWHEPEELPYTVPGLTYQTRMSRLHMVRQGNYMTDYVEW